MALVDYGYSSDEDDGEDEYDIESSNAVSGAMEETSMQLDSKEKKNSSMTELNVIMEQVVTEPPIVLQPNSQKVPHVPAREAVILPSPADLFSSSPSAAVEFGSMNRRNVKESRKRTEVNGNVHLAPHQKTARGTLAVHRHSPDTGGGVLLPPQLRGRSNIVTEDLGILFSRKPKVSSGTHPSRMQE